MQRDLLSPAPALAVVHLELTTRCNVRCIYCHRSFTEAGLSPGRDFPIELIPSLIDGLKASGLRHLRVSGDGETTVHPHWREICGQFMAAGFDLEIVSNFAKKFNQEELNTLARFKRILVSCDTTDSEMLPRLRRGTSVERISANVRAVAEAARTLGIPLPQLCLSVVVTDKIVFALEKTIEDALSLGFHDFFLNDLVPGPQVASDFGVKPIWTMPREQAIEARRCLESALSIAAEAGAIVVATSGLKDTLEGVLEGEHSADLALGRWSSPPPEPHESRHCLTLWRHSYISVDGSVRPCCVPTTPTMGSLRERPFNEILNGEPYRNFRKRFLSGDLPDVCKNCALAGVVSKEGLQTTVTAIVRDLAEIVDSFLPKWKEKRVVVYGAGGHSHKLFAETAISSIPLLGIIDRNPRLRGTTLANVPVYSLEALDTLKPEVIVISSLELEDEIYQQLEPYRMRGADTVRLYRSVE